MENDQIQGFGWRSPKAILILIALLVLGGVSTVSILRDRLVYRPDWQITVSGQGKLIYQPDIAKIFLGVKVNNEAKAENALKQLNEQINKIFSALEQQGVAKKDIQTQNYTLTPHYDLADNSKVTGYDANQVLIIKLNIKEKSDNASQIIAAASKAGANQVNGISFESSNLNDLKQQVRLLAIEDAKSKAGATAGKLGVKFDKIIGWWENYSTPENQSYYSGDFYGMGGGATPTIPGGPHELIVEVSLNYKIK